VVPELVEGPHKNLLTTPGVAMSALRYRSPSSVMVVSTSSTTTPCGRQGAPSATARNIIKLPQIPSELHRKQPKSANFYVIFVKKTFIKSKNCLFQPKKRGFYPLFV